MLLSFTATVLRNHFMEGFKSTVAVLFVFGVCIATSHGRNKCKTLVFNPKSPFYFSQQMFWDNRTNSILFADSGAPNGAPSVFRFDWETKQFFSASLANTKKPDPVSFVVPTASCEHTLIAGHVNSVIKLTWDGISPKAEQTEVIARRVSEDGAAIDRGATAPDGKLYMSIIPSTWCEEEVMNYPEAAIVRLSVEDSSIRGTLFPGTYSNGLVFDSKSEKCYIADDCTGSLVENKLRGEILERSREVYKVPKDAKVRHYPSGLAIDKCSNIYVGDHDSGHIVYVDTKTGKVIKTFTVPGTHVTAVDIVGPELNYLCVLTGTTYHNIYGTDKSTSKNRGDGQMYLIPISSECTGYDCLGNSGTPIAGF